MTAGGDNTARCTCPENGRVADCPIARHREQWETLGRRPVPVADRQTDEEHRNLSEPGNGRCSCGARPIAGEHIPTWWARHVADPTRHLVAADGPTTDRQTDEERPGPDIGPGTLAARLADWREEQAAAARPAHADAVMANLGAAITEGVTEVRLREGKRRLAWFTDAELADELARRAALGGEG